MSEGTGGGYIKLWRKIRHHTFWRERRRFSRLEAWLDLLMLANFTDSKILRGATWIEVRRGQVFTSQVALAHRWRWHRETVSMFLKALKADTMIDIETASGADSGYTIVTICKYEQYQGRDAEHSDNGADNETGDGADIGPATDRHIRRRSKKSQEGRKGRADARKLPPSTSPSNRPSRKSVDADWDRPPWTEEDFR